MRLLLPLSGFLCADMLQQTTAFRPASTGRLASRLPANAGESLRNGIKFILVPNARPEYTPPPLTDQGLEQSASVLGVTPAAPAPPALGSVPVEAPRIAAPLLPAEPTEPLTAAPPAAVVENLAAVPSSPIESPTADIGSFNRMELPNYEMKVPEIPSIQSVLPTPTDTQAAAKVSFSNLGEYILRNKQIGPLQFNENKFATVPREMDPSKLIKVDDASVFGKIFAALGATFELLKEGNVESQTLMQTAKVDEYGAIYVCSILILMGALVGSSNKTSSVTKTVEPANSKTITKAKVDSSMDEVSTVPVTTPSPSQPPREWGSPAPAPAPAPPLPPNEKAKLEQMRQLTEATVRVSKELTALKAQKASSDYEVAKLRSDLRDITNKLDASASAEQELSFLLKREQRKFEEQVAALQLKLQQADAKLRREAQDVPALTLEKAVSPKKERSTSVRSTKRETKVTSTKKESTKRSASPEIETNVEAPKKERVKKNASIKKESTDATSIKKKGTAKKAATVKKENNTTDKVTKKEETVQVKTATKESTIESTPFNEATKPLPVIKKTGSSQKDLSTQSDVAPKSINPKDDVTATNLSTSEQEVPFFLVDEVPTTDPSQIETIDKNVSENIGASNKRKVSTTKNARSPKKRGSDEALVAELKDTELVRKEDNTKQRTIAKKEGEKSVDKKEKSITDETTTFKASSSDDWSRLSQSTLQRKTVKELTAYLEAKGLNTKDSEGKSLKKAELVAVVLSR